MDKQTILNNYTKEEIYCKYLTLRKDYEVLNTRYEELKKEKGTIKENPYIFTWEKNMFQFIRDNQFRPLYWENFCGPMGMSSHNVKEILRYYEKKGRIVIETKAQFWKEQVNSDSTDEEQIYVWTIDSWKTYRDKKIAKGSNY